MKWFIAKITYQIICGEGNHTPQFDEQIRLISAPNSRHALEKAHEIGMAGAETFKNTSQKLVQWKFINVEELYQLDEMIDGAELFSRIHEPANADWFIKMISKKAKSIRREVYTPLVANDEMTMQK
jgi:hypothetical protein